MNRVYQGKTWAGVLISKDDFWTDLCGGHRSVYTKDDDGRRLEDPYEPETGRSI